MQQHEDIDEALRGQRINWLIRLAPTVNDPGGAQVVVETQVKMDGAYNCQLQDEFTAGSGLLPDELCFEFDHLAGEGGLSDTWHDDCFGHTDGDPASQGLPADPTTSSSTSPARGAVMLRTTSTRCPPVTPARPTARQTCATPRKPATSTSSTASTV